MSESTKSFFKEWGQSIVVVGTLICAAGGLIGAGFFIEDRIDRKNKESYDQLSTQISELKTELKTEISDLGFEISDLKIDLESDIKKVRGEIKEIRGYIVDHLEGHP